MISFLGFNANLDDILEKVEKCFGKQLSGDHLQQEFLPNLLKTKMRK